MDQTMAWAMRIQDIPPMAIARYGLGAVFLAFGIMQWSDPAGWFGYLPVHGVFGLSDATLIYLNGALDFAIGVSLLLGILTRMAAIIAALHLAGIIAFLGFNDVAVRDAGLLIVAIAIALNGPDAWCLRKKWRSTARSR